LAGGCCSVEVEAEAEAEVAFLDDEDDEELAVLLLLLFVTIVTDVLKRCLGCCGQEEGRADVGITFYDLSSRDAERRME